MVCESTALSKEKSDNNFKGIQTIRKTVIKNGDLMLFLNNILGIYSFTRIFAHAPILLNSKRASPQSFD